MGRALRLLVAVAAASVVLVMLPTAAVQAVRVPQTMSRR